MFEEPLKEQLLLICELNNLFYHCTPPFFEGFGNKSIKRRNKSSLLTAKKNKLSAQSTEPPSITPLNILL